MIRTATRVILLFLLIFLSIKPLSAQRYHLSRQQLQAAGGSLSNSIYRLRQEFGLLHSGSMRGDKFKTGLATGVQIIEAGETAVHAYALNQNYPNPFNQSTSLAYEIPKSARVRIFLYSILGQQVRCLFDGGHAAGRFVLHYDGTDVHGQPLPSGLYLLVFEADDTVKTIKVSIVR
ncbi:T9SS type A sorting domain-containing protein [candidate division KSB1 bacterium]|nr:T9SS type A sorting domain-containing protein [candidate division KSB1 bacterium]